MTLAPLSPGRPPHEPSARRPRGLLAALALLAVAAVAAPPTVAQDAAPAADLKPAVVAVIDYQRILRESAAARNIREQVEARRKTYQDEINGATQRLQEEDRTLAKQRSLLAPDAFAQKRKAFEQEAIGVQRLFQERRRLLDEGSGKAFNALQSEIVKIVAGLARQKRVNVVLPNEHVLVFDKEIDFTQEVLTRLNAALPEVAVAFETPN